jgi:hypothetical protein
MVNALNEAVATLLAKCDGTSPCPGPDAVSTLFFGENGPFWTRSYPFTAEASLCSKLDDVLHAVGAQQVVVGHTVQVREVTKAWSMVQVLLMFWLAMAATIRAMSAGLPICGYTV